MVKVEKSIPSTTACQNVAFLEAVLESSEHPMLGVAHVTMVADIAIDYYVDADIAALLSVIRPRNAAPARPPRLLNHRQPVS